MKCRVATTRMSSHFPSHVPPPPPKSWPQNEDMLKPGSGNVTIRHDISTNMSIFFDHDVIVCNIM